LSGYGDAFLLSTLSNFMETLKKYWPLFLLVPVVAYIGYSIWKDSQTKSDGAAKAREAKAAKAALKNEVDTELTAIENGRVNSEN
jgi:hypothetical protein